jgi:hypothetical protein
MERLCRAEAMIDTLIQGEDDWIATEEEDRDGDLVEEVFAANRHLSAWLVPAQAGALRTLDDRNGCRNLLDVGIRRAEPFFGEMAQADLAGETGESVGPPKRGSGLVRRAPELPTLADNIERAGIREWLVEGDVRPDEFFSGTIDRSSQRTPRTEILESSIDEEGDCSFTLRVRSELRLEGLKPRIATVYKAVALPIDAAEIAIAYDVEVDGDGEALLAMEIPLRLGTAAPRVEVDGRVVELRQNEYPEARLVRVQGEGEPVLLVFEPGVDLWLSPVRTTVRDLDGYWGVEHGVVFVPVLRVMDKAGARVQLRVGDSNDAEPEDADDSEDDLDAGVDETRVIESGEPSDERG